MEFAQKNLYGLLKTIGVIFAVIVCAYIFLHILPVLIIVGIAVYCFIKFKKHKISKFARNDAKAKEDVKKQNDFKAYDDLDGDIIDVEYKDV